MTGTEILGKMEEGFSLHSCPFGWFMMNPIDCYTFNVHNGAAKALARSGRIKKTIPGGLEGQWTVYTPKEGDKARVLRRIGRGLAEKGELVTITGILAGERLNVKPDSQKAGFIAKASELRFLPNYEPTNQNT